MKRLGNLYQEVVRQENLIDAFQDAIKNKKSKRAVYYFQINFGREISKLKDELEEGSYKPMPYKRFFVFEPKKREIFAPAFRDIVVQHAVYRVVYPLCEKTFISESHGCRKNYGIHSAREYIKKVVKESSQHDYYLQLDIKKYFYSFDRAVLRQIIEKKIKDEKLVNLMMMFAEFDSDKGVPIGNLLSQLYGLMYLNPLDHFIKRELKIKNYVRYVDDFVLIGLKLDEARRLKTEVEDYIRKSLMMELSKYKIMRISNGIDFAGYRIWNNRSLVRKYSIYKFRRACKKERIESLISMIGHAWNTDTVKYYKKLLLEFNLFSEMPFKLRLKMADI